MSTLELVIDRVDDRLYRYKVRIKSKKVEIKTGDVVCMTYSDQHVNKQQEAFLRSFFDQIVEHIRHPYNNSENWTYFRPCSFDLEDGCHSVHPDGKITFVSGRLHKLNGWTVKSTPDDAPKPEGTETEPSQMNDSS
ncbi:hypothetical protein BC940DRAFT_337363 [Gongronella butleri]|nr:hypothetical protein BC940DRAFT_337363 [Gongronella butleri]